MNFLVPVYAVQRVLNVLLRISDFVRRRRICLLPHPLPPSPVSKIGQQHTGQLRKRNNLLKEERGGGGGGGAKSYDGEKAWYSLYINEYSLMQSKKLYSEQIISLFLLIYLYMFQVDDQELLTEAIVFC